MAKTATLITGLTYTYEKVKYLNRVPRPVDNATGSYLEATGRFIVVTGGAAKPKKVRIKKPDTDKVEKDLASGEIPNFRSKKELADFAKDTYDFQFEGKLKFLKMNDMVEELEAYIEANSTPASKEVSIEV